MQEGKLGDLRRIQAATLALLRRRAAGVPHEVVGDELLPPLKRIPQRQCATLADQRCRAIHLDHGQPPAGGCHRVAGPCVSFLSHPQCVQREKVPVSPETRFRIGTASTALTSAAVGLLLEKDRLKLDEKIQTYVPEFPEKQWPVTLRQVMGHVAGVRSDGGDEGPLYRRAVRSAGRRAAALSTARCGSSRGPSTAFRTSAGFS